MSYAVISEPEALAQAEQFAEDDPAGVRQVFTAVDRLADDPRPEGAFSGADVLRIHVGRYRVRYEVSDQQIRVSVIHLGRLRRTPPRASATPCHGEAIGQELGFDDRHRRQHPLRAGVVVVPRHVPATASGTKRSTTESRLSASAAAIATTSIRYAARRYRSADVRNSWTSARVDSTTAPPSRCSAESRSRPTSEFGCAVVLLATDGTGAGGVPLRVPGARGGPGVLPGPARTPWA
ncbi:hypothetical protein GCM10010278_85750 [Streptomyces melanogenes]|nr:hypothetical protein GCM10010278_85750 [Streptomyces melanogenes]